MSAVRSLFKNIFYDSGLLWRLIYFIRGGLGLTHYVIESMPHKLQCSKIILLLRLFPFPKQSFTQTLRKFRIIMWIQHFNQITITFYCFVWVVYFWQRLKMTQFSHVTIHDVIVHNHDKGWAKNSVRYLYRPLSHITIRYNMTLFTRQTWYNGIV